MMDEKKRNLGDAIFGAVSQAVSLELGRLVSKYPAELHPIVFATIHACNSAAVNRLPQDYKRRYDNILEHLQVVTLDPGDIYESK